MTASSASPQPLGISNILFLQWQLGEYTVKEAGMGYWLETISVKHKWFRGVNLTKESYLHF